MAILSCNPSNISSVVSGAAFGDVLVMDHGTPPIVYPSLPKKAGLTYQGGDWEVGKAVRDAGGHMGANCGVKVTAGLDTGLNDVRYRGFFHDGRGLGINLGVITGNNNRCEDLVTIGRKSNGGRTIGYTWGSGSAKVTGMATERCRHHFSAQVGEALDHPYYLKRLNGYVMRDCLIYDAGYFAFHLYNDADGGLIENNVVYKNGKGITFSGANDSSTGVAGYAASDNNVVRRNIFSDATNGGYLIEAYWGGGAGGTGNIVEENYITRGGGTANPVQPNMPGVTVRSNNVIGGAAPGYTNPAIGDFRLVSGAPATGYGPSYIQPGGTPPPPPPPPPPDDPEPTDVFIGHWPKGVTGYKGMSADKERNCQFLMPANYQVREARVHGKGDGLGTSTQPAKVILRTAIDLVKFGESQERTLSAAAAEGRQVFTFASPVAGFSQPTQITVGIHTGAKSAGGGEWTYSYEAKTQALRVGDDVYADGTLTVMGTVVYDNVEMAIVLILDPATAPATPPNPVTSFDAVAQPGQATISWVLPVTGPLPIDGVMVRRKTGSYPTSPTDGDQAFYGLTTGFVDTGLPDGVPQFWRAWTKKGTLYSTTFASDTDTPTTPPIVTRVKVPRQSSPRQSGSR